MTTTLDGTDYRQDFAFDTKFGRLTGARQSDCTAVYYQYNAKDYPSAEHDSTNFTNRPLRSIIGMDQNGLLTEVGYRNNLGRSKNYTQDVQEVYQYDIQD